MNVLAIKEIELCIYNTGFVVVLFTARLALKSETTTHSGVSLDSEKTLIIILRHDISKGLFIWRRVVPGWRVTLHTEPHQAMKIFIHFFINSSEPFT